MDDKGKTEDQLINELATLRRQVALLQAMDTKHQQAQGALFTRARQQAAIAELGQQALAGLDVTTLLDEAVVCIATTLSAEFGAVMELLPDGQALLLRAGVGWHTGLVGTATVEAGAASQAGYTLLSSTPVIIDDLRTVTRFSASPLLHDYGVVSGMSVVIQDTPHPFGILGVYTTRRRSFSTDDIHFLQAVAHVLAEAIQRQRSEAALATHSRQIDALRAVTIEITRELHLSTLLSLIIQRAVELVGMAETGTVHLWDEAEQSLTIQAWHGLGEWVRDVRMQPGEGLLGAVVQRRQGLLVNDYPRSPYAHPLWLARLRPVAVMAEPLLYRERLVGVIVVGHRKEGYAFSAEDHNLLALFAAQAATAIENARLFEENTRRQARLATILGINKRIAASEDMGSLLRRVAEEATEFVGADGAHIRLRQGDRLVVLAEADYGAALAWAPDIGLWEGRAGQIVREKRAIVVPDIQTDPDILPTYKVHAAQGGIHSLVSIPITGRHEVIGVLNVMSKQPRQFTAEEVVALSACAEQAAIAIEQARLVTEVRQQMTRLEQTTAALRDSEARYRMLFETCPDALAIFDTNLNMTMVNQRSVALYGYESSAAMLGKNMHDVLAPQDWPRAAASIEEMQKTGRNIRDIEFTMLKKDGTRFPCEVNAACLMDAAGKLTAIFSIARDITERKRTEQAEREHGERLHGIYEIAQAILLAKSPEEIARHTLRRMRQLVPCDLAWVALIDLSTHEATTLAFDSDDKMWLPKDKCVPLEFHDGLDLLRQGMVYMVEDVLTCVLPPAVLQRRLAQGVRAYLRVPLMVQGVLIGSLNLQQSSPGAFAPEQVAVAREVAGQLAVALQQARLHAEIQRRVQELTAIAQVSEALQQSHTLDTLPPQLIRTLAQLLGYEYGAVLLLDESTGRLIPFALHDQGDGPAFVEVDRARVMARGSRHGGGIIGWVAQTGESVCIGDVRQDPRYHAVRDNMRSELCVPLRLGDRVIGVINVESTRPYAYTEADQRVLETVAGQIAIAIQNVQLFKQLSNANARLQTLSHQLVNAQETERRAVARELHDEIGQALTAVQINLQGLERLPAAALVPHLQDSVSTVDHIIQQVRELALTLHPSLLDDLGLVPALRWYIDRQAQHTGFMVQFVAESLPTRLPQDLEIACFRIVQEALTNVLRHAQAHQAQIELSQRDATLHLVIRDDGVGFNVDAAQQRAARGESMGLLSMQERVLLAGGELEVISAPRRGTEIRVRFPL